MKLPAPRPNLQALRPYQVAISRNSIYNLSANEACLGPSLSAVSAAAAAANSLDTYPDGSASALRNAIGKRYDLDPSRIICGAGSEELISLIVQAYAAPGDEVLFTQFGFIKYELAARAFGAIPIRAPESDFTADVDALIASVTPRTRIVFLANPNNPTGTFLHEAQVRRLRAGLRSDILLVIDAAYAEFVATDTYDNGLSLARSTGNTLALRTFSKIHGLAGLRCGWGFGAQELVDTLHKVRGAFNVGSVSQAAAAAAIADIDHEARARDHNIAELAWLTDRFQSAGIAFIPSVCNFVVVRFNDAETCQRALEALAGQGVLAMPLNGYGISEAIRITIGTRDANEAVLRGLMGVRHEST
ncbi:histidinol-phosphate transaminase [Variovorax paradoxus]|nr:histidinol-phosphate transaminase [Variovorax paradoxus]